jgi:hypothetical protein
MDFAADFGWDRFAGRLHAILHSRFPQLGDGRHPE